MRQYIWPTPASASFSHLTHQVGGYQGPTLSDQYMGIGLLAVLVLGATLWRRDRRIWLFGAVGLVSVVLTLGVENPVWVPWRWLRTVPLVQNIIPLRFVAGSYLAAAIIFGLIIDHARSALLARSTGVGAGRRWDAGAVGGLVALVGLVPIAGYLAPSLPMTTQRVELPRWFSEVAPQLPPGQVLLTFPVPLTTLQSGMTWQAVDGMHYAMVGGGGPGALWYRAGTEEKGQAILVAASLGSLPPADSTPAAIASVRRALDGWGVTMVVIPDQSGLPQYEQTRSATSSVALITAATGRRPVHQDDAWVWSAVDRAGPSAPLTSTAFQHCIDGPDGGLTPVVDVPSCVLGSWASP